MRNRPDRGTLLFAWLFFPLMFLGLSIFLLLALGGTSAFAASTEILYRTAAILALQIILLRMLAILLTEKISHRDDVIGGVLFPLTFIWIAIILTAALFARIFEILGIVSADGATTADYSTCLYYSVVTLTTLGYGDYRPTSLARPFAALEALYGYILLGMIVGAVVATLSAYKPAALDKPE